MYATFVQRNIILTFFKQLQLWIIHITTTTPPSPPLTSPHLSYVRSIKLTLFILFCTFSILTIVSDGESGDAYANLRTWNMYDSMESSCLICEASIVCNGTNGAVSENPEMDLLFPNTFIPRATSRENQKAIKAKMYVR